MTDEERDQFHRITRQRELADLKDSKPPSARGTAFVMALLGFVIMAGGIAALALESWKVAAGTAIAVFGIVFIAGAVNMRRM